VFTFSRLQTPKPNISKQEPKLNQAGQSEQSSNDLTEFSNNLTKTYWIRNPDVIGRNIAEEYVLVPIKQSMVDFQAMYSLNEVGAFLWDELKTKKSQAELLVALNARYEVTTEQAQQDISDFLTELVKNNLVLKS
jgi:hypothetical protein